MLEKAMAMLPVRMLRIAHTIILAIVLLMISQATALWWSLDSKLRLQPGALDSFGVAILVGVLAICGGMVILSLVIGRIERLFQRYAQRGLEIAQQDSENLALIAQTIDAAVIVTDRNGLITWVNQSFSRITGYGLDEVRGQIPGRLLHGKRTDRGTVARMRECIHKGEAVRAEIINYAKDGREYWLDLNIQPVRDKYGNISQFIAVNSEITLQKRQEEELRQTRNFLQEVIDRLPMALHVKDYKEGAGGRFKLWNRKATEFSGLEAMTTVGRSDFDFWTKEQADSFRAQDMETFRDGRLIEIPDESINSPVLGHRWLHTRKIPVFDKLGRPDYLLSIAEDITERKDVADRLQRLVAFQDQLMDTIPSPIFYKDSNGVYQGCNRSFEAYLGRRREEIVGRTVFEISPSELAERYHAQDLALISQGGFQNYEFNVRHADGSLHDVMFQKATFTDETGKVAGLVGVMLDITENKKNQAQLANEKSLLRAIIDSIPDPIYFKDANGVYLGCNKSYAAMRGQPEAELIGRTEDVPTGLKTADIIRAQEQLILATGKPYHAEEWFTYPDGREILLETLKTFYCDDDRQLLGFIGISRDITERKRVWDALNTAKEDAEKANRAKSVFLATMSHEIRTPLTSIIGFAELLADPSIDREMRRDAECTILRGGKHLLSIINDILDLSKIEAGQLGLESIPFSPLEIHSGLDSELGTLAREKGVEFHTAVEYPMPSLVLGDSTRWKQILLNLCGNAVKFTARGSVTVTVSYDRSKARLICRVADTGIGISTEQADNLFRPFAQADNSITRKYGGTGLGLHLVRHLTDAMGGNVTVKSEPGIGSEFLAQISAPMAEGAQVLTIGPKPRDRISLPAKVPSRHLSGRVLLAEDGLDNRKLICAFLGKLGLEMVTADNGEQAVEQALAGNFDVILMDIQMPVLDGVSATELLRAAGYGRPIIALTANVMTEDVQRYLRSGCTHCVGKPIDFTALNLLLCELLQPEALEHSRVMGNDQIPGYAEIKAEFEARFPDRIRQLKVLIGESDWGGARLVAHTLAGTAGSFGHAEVGTAARVLERALVENKPEQIGSALLALLDLLAVRDLCTNKGKV